MPNLFGTLTAFTRSPAGKRAIRQATGAAQRLAKDPRAREQVQRLRARLTDRKGPPPEAR